MIDKLKRNLESRHIGWRERNGYIFITSQVSENGDALWLEFWENSDENDDPPVRKDGNKDGKGHRLS